MVSFEIRSHVPYVVLNAVHLICLTQLNSHSTLFHTEKRAAAFSTEYTLRIRVRLIVSDS